MAETLKETFESWLNKIQSGLVESYISKGLKASGEWEKSLEQFYSKEGGKFTFGIKANDYSEYMQNGRRPNKKQGHENLVKWAYWATNEEFSTGGFISKWARVKGLSGNPFGIAYNIAKEGIKVPNTHNVGGLVTDVVNDESIKELSDSLTLFFVNKIRSDLRQIFD